MREIQHNMVSILYSIKASIDSHFVQADEGRFSDTEARHDHATDILKRAGAQADRALWIAKRIGALLKASAKQDNGSSKASLPCVWKKVRRILREMPVSDAVKIVSKISKEFPLIHCQANELAEVLYYLCQNAIQAMEKDGRLVIQAQIGFSTKEEPKALILISDSGPGIPQKQLKLLFEPFFTTKSPTEGNGLGLYLVRRLVEKNHGKIYVSSFPGFGTTFILEFAAIPNVRRRAPKSDKRKCHSQV